MFPEFNQQPPQLPDPLTEDPQLLAWLEEVLPGDALDRARPVLRRMADHSQRLYPISLADRLSEPQLTQWGAWGRRWDEVSVTRVWREAQIIAAEEGVVATGWDTNWSEHARTVQFALAYLFTPSTDIYSCPLAMTDGAVAALRAGGNQELVDRAVPHLLSTDPDQFWTSGQWMTETAGGSDVSNTGTQARQDEQGHWRLFGRKWFTSAVTSQMALTLARVGDTNTEDQAGGNEAADSHGNAQTSPLALFYVETRGEDGRTAPGLEVLRLKDKLGTRKLPTAELRLDGLRAWPVKGLDQGVRHIAPMLNITRTWNAVAALGLMRRGLSLAQDYARRRRAFGKLLIEHPLHQRTLNELEDQFATCFALTFYVISLLGKAQHGTATDAEQRLLRLLTPVAKAYTAKKAVAVLSEVLECFGGAGYVEDTGLPVLLRDAQVLPIWEGTTNILSLDVLRVIQAAPQVLEDLTKAAQVDLKAVRTQLNSPDAQANARDICLSLGEMVGSAKRLG